MPESSYLIESQAQKPSAPIAALIDEFREEVPSLEATQKLPFVLMQDGKSQAYYIECHLLASDAVPLADLDAVLDPDEQEQFRLQRELQTSNPAFLQMCEDAIGKRQFADIIAEYDTSYRPDTPLKVLGGQHRLEAMKRAFENQQTSRYHGFRIYFGLTVDQRNEIAQIANTNIAISLDLLDRMQETVRGPQLRNFCHATGLLESNEDFADRKNPEGKITVRLARTFVVNFFNGRKLSKSKIDELIPIPHVCKSGQDDPEYVVIAGKKIWNDKELIEAGSRFSLLHKKQMETIGQDPDLNNAEFRNKAISMAVLSSWAFTAGVLQENPTALKKLYSLPDLSGNQDPLNAKTMSESRHPKDAPTYRGLGTRYSEEDRGRVTELFIQYATTLQKKVISGPMVDAAIMNYEAKVAALKAKQAKAKLQ